MIETSDLEAICRVFGRLIFRATARLFRAPMIKTSDLKAAGAHSIDFLLNSGHLNIAEHATRLLHAAFPTLAYARNLCGIFDRLPAAEGAHSGLKDDATNDVQVVAKNSEIVVLLFCGAGHRLGLPLPMVHRWLARLPASLIYLRDFKCAYFLHGVQSLGPTRNATLTELRRIITSLHGRRIVCYGNSGGVFAALDFGLELGADAVLCMAGPTNLSSEFNIHTSRETKSFALQSQFPNAHLDLRDAYSAIARPPRVCIVYGRNSWDDRFQAENMGGLSCVTLCGIENCANHNVITEVIIRGKYDGLLDWLVRKSEDSLIASHHADNPTRPQPAGLPAER